MHDGDYPSMTECECVVEGEGEEGLRKKGGEEQKKRDEARARCEESGGVWGGDESIGQGQSLGSPCGDRPHYFRGPLPKDTPTST